MKPKNQKHVQKALEMRAKGKRVPEIADKLGYSEATIYGWFKQHQNDRISEYEKAVKEIKGLEDTVTYETPKQTRKKKKIFALLSELHKLVDSLY